MASKYDPLSRYLRSLDATAWQATFRDIERVLGFQLPASARNHRSWWHNNTIGHPQAPAWMDVGWLTTDVDMAAETLVFRSGGVAASRRVTHDAVRVTESVARDNSPSTPAVQVGSRSNTTALELGIPFDLNRLMNGLSQARPVFHSRDDFRRSFSSHLRKLLPELHIQSDSSIAIQSRSQTIDIWFEASMLGIKLMYTTRGLDLEWGNERYVLREHGGQPPRRYEFLKGVQTIEEAISCGPAKMGYSILLTNQPDYWNAPSRQDVIDAAFRLHEGSKVSGELKWSERAGKGTIKGKEAPIDLLGSYDLHWRDYSRLGNGNNQQFRYLAVMVQ